MPESARSMRLRFALGALIVVSFTATTTAVAGLLEFKQLAKDISGSLPIKHANVVIPQPGSPQTILIIGSDRRAHAAIDDARSDTIMLVRLSGDSSTINVLSIPRDLRVQIPHANGLLETAKVNAAYTEGGPNLTVKVLKQVLPGLQVNHIVDINFRGFKDLVNAIGCVYTDVDRRYYHSNAGLPASLQYSEIDIQPGYQKLCDEQALSYVRFRHADTDIVRSARQQDFIRQAKDQYGQANLIANRHQLLTLFGRHTRTDPDLHTANGIENLFNLVAFSAGHTIREVHFPAILEPCTPAQCYVSATPDALSSAMREFMAVVAAPPPAAVTRPAPAAAAGGAGASKAAGATGGRGPGGSPPTPGLTTDSAGGKAQAAALGHAGMPVYVPQQIASGSSFGGPNSDGYPRAYELTDSQGGRHAAYRIVIALDKTMGRYYGVQGMTWRGAPILAGASETRVLGGKRLELHFDGRRLRLVAWRTSHGVYWVSNTLTQDIGNQQLLAIAASLAPPGR
jgi:LCP family protein required for cell wall assembly